MRHGLTDLEALANTFSYADIEVGVTIEIHSNRKRQQVRLLEHAYSVQSASYTPAPVANPALDGHENPIRRAIRWNAMMAGNKMKAYAVASAEKVSPTLVSLHLKLLEKLPQSVIDYLRDGRDSTLKKKISFRELERLAERRLPDAIAWFHARISGQPLQEVMSLGE